MRIWGRRFLWLVLWSGTLLGCGGESRIVIRSASPLNGSTKIATDFRPSISIEGSTFNLKQGDRNILLREFLGTQSRVVAGTIDWQPDSVTYITTAPLTVDRDYELEIAKATFGEAVSSIVDSSESPDELVQFPYRLRFSTRSGPRVRAVYFEKASDRQSLFVKFSQPMNQVASATAFRVTDPAKQPLSIAAPIWVDSLTARIDLTATLTASTIYGIEVGIEATSSDGQLLDQNGDGKGGDGDGDRFVGQFTDAQLLPILSRLPK